MNEKQCTYSDNDNPRILNDLGFDSREQAENELARFSYARAEKPGTCSATAILFGYLGSECCIPEGENFFFDSGLRNNC